MRASLCLVALAAASAAFVPARAVRVDVYVMSKCPDAAACENEFIPVFKQLGSAVDVTFNYIGSGNESSPECMHGPSECAGNRQQLCAQKHLSHSAFLDFVRCQDQSFELIPQNGQSCAKNHWSTISTCADGDEGHQLLVDSVGVSRKTGVRVSCTVNVDDSTFCVHNGGWQECGACADYGANKATCLRDFLCRKLPAGDRPAACNK